MMAAHLPTLENIKNKMLAIKQEKTNAELRAEQSEDKQKQLMEKLQAVRFHATNYLPSCRYISINIFFLLFTFYFSDIKYSQKRSVFYC